MPAGESTHWLNLANTCCVPCNAVIEHDRKKRGKQSAVVLRGLLLGLLRSCDFLIVLVGWLEEWEWLIMMLMITAQAQLTNILNHRAGTRVERSANEHRTGGRAKVLLL